MNNFFWKKKIKQSDLPGSLAIISKSILSIRSLKIEYFSFYALFYKSYFYLKPFFGFKLSYAHIFGGHCLLCIESTTEKQLILSLSTKYRLKTFSKFNFRQIDRLAYLTTMNYGFKTRIRVLDD